MNRPIHFTTDSKWDAKSERIDFEFITSIEAHISDGSAEYSRGCIGIAFSGYIWLGLQERILNGFYSPTKRDGYIIIPLKSQEEILSEGIRQHDYQKIEAVVLRIVENKDSTNEALSNLARALMWLPNDFYSVSYKLTRQMITTFFQGLDEERLQKVSAFCTNLSSKQSSNFRLDKIEWLLKK